MKRLLACAGALALVGACGVSGEANTALEAMNIASGDGELVKYASKSGSGDKVTFQNVELGPEGDGLRAGSMTLEGLSMNDAGEPVVSGITLSDVTPTEDLDGVQLNVEAVTLTGLDAVTGAFLAKAFRGEDPGDAPPFEQWVVGNASIQGLTLVGDMEAMGQGGGGFNVTLDELSLADLENEVAGRFGWSGFSGTFSVPPETAGYQVDGSFDFGNLQIGELQGGTFADAFEAGLVSMMNPAAALDPGAGLPPSPIDPGFNQLEWSGMNIAAAGLTLSTSEMSSRAERNGEGIVTSVESPRASIKLAVDSENPGTLGSQAQMFMGMLGFSELELYSESKGTFDPETDTTRYETANLGMTDAFDISLTGGFQGVNDALRSLMASANSGGQPDMSGLANLRIVDMEFSVADNSLMEKVFNLAPMFVGQDAASLRADLVSQVSALGEDMAAAGVDSAISNELSAAIANFIQQPGVLTLKLNPSEPVAFANPSGPLTKESLGFSAEYTAN